MGLFSRNKEATDPPVADEGRFEPKFDAVKRAPRRASRATPLEAESDAPAPLDPAHTAKTRARRRLIGAVAIGLAAVVFVPMLFDRSKSPLTDDIAVRIPDRDSAFEGRRGVPAPTPSTNVPLTATPVTSEPVASPPPASPAVEEPTSAVVDPTPIKSVEAPVDKPATKAIDKPAPSKPVVVEKSVAEKPAVAKAVVEKPPTDDPRALAALEGKPAVAAPSDASGKGFAVQIAAYSTVERARGLRDQLTSNGLKAYTEPLSTAQGPRTRVRLGPFATREAADRAKQKLKTLKLDGSVVPL